MVVYTFELNGICGSYAQNITTFWIRHFNNKKVQQTPTVRDKSLQKTSDFNREDSCCNNGTQVCNMNAKFVTEHRVTGLLQLILLCLHQTKNKVIACHTNICNIEYPQITNIGFEVSSSLIIPKSKESL